MEVLKVEKESKMKIDWYVGYKIEQDESHGIDEAYVIIATFSTLQNAEDFITKCIPVENQSRFFIEDPDNGIRYFNF